MNFGWCFHGAIGIGLGYFIGATERGADDVSSALFMALITGVFFLLCLCAGEIIGWGVERLKKR